MTKKEAKKLYPAFLNSLQEKQETVQTISSMLSIALRQHKEMLDVVSEMEKKLDIK